MDDKGRFYSKEAMTKKNARQQQKALYAGAGFLGNVLAKIKQVGNKVIQTLGSEEKLRRTTKAVESTVRLDYPPKVREILNKYGAGTVYNLIIVREPLESVIEDAINIITLGKWNIAKKKYNYDRMFHLYMIASLSMPNGDKQYIKIEKNQVINMSDNVEFPEKSEYIRVPVECCITLFDLMNKTKEAIGSNFFKYDAFNNNCQNFLLNILKVNELLTPQIAGFINQNVEQLLQELPSFTQPFAGLITGIAGLANRFVEGEGKEIYGGCMKQCNCMEAKLKGGVLSEISEALRQLNNVTSFDDIRRIMDSLRIFFQDEDDVIENINTNMSEYENKNITLM
jgi:hypothetical protein